MQEASLSGRVGFIQAVALAAMRVNVSRVQTSAQRLASCDVMS